MVLNHIFRVFGILKVCESLQSKLLWKKEVDIQFIKQTISDYFPLFPGPLVLVLKIFKRSHRQSMMLAGIIAASSSVASMFAPNVEILILTYAILAGIWNLWNHISRVSPLNRFYQCSLENSTEPVPEKVKLTKFLHRNILNY